MTDIERALAIYRAKTEAARAELTATLLAAPDSVRGCSVVDCPGPRAANGSCPLGWAGSCRRTIR